MNSEEEVNTFNKYMVALAADGIVILNPPRGPMSNDDALLLAAWLATLAEDYDGEAVSKIIKASLS